MTSKFPQLKKKVNAFLVGEDGKISKSNILNASLLLAGTGVLVAANSQTSYAGFSSDASCVYHSSHSSHGSHASHASHASHGSHGQW